MIPQLDPEKVKQLKPMEELFTEFHGPKGSPSRLEFEAQARAWYYGEILKGQRKDAHITRQQLADRVGKKREYIAKLERGETDMQLSTFIMISEALGLRFTLTLG